MHLFIVSILLQVALVMHVIKTGRSTTWIWLIAFLPIAGSVAYIVFELIPDLLGSRTGRSTKRKISSIVNPNKDINEAANNYSISNTVENSMKLASECLNKGMYEEAHELYAKCLRGAYQNDPDLMAGLAESQFGLKQYQKAKEKLDELIELNPDYKNPEAHLIYAKSLEQLGEINSAIQEYEILDNYYSGPEPTYRLAKILKNQGQIKKAQDLLNKILEKSDISGGHYNKLHKKWINLAKDELHS